MPRSTMKPFNLEIDDSINEIVDEGSGNSYIALRKLRWNDDAPFKLDIRRWFVNSDGEEIAGKGVSFITEEGPHNLAEILTRNEFGRTDVILDNIKERADFLYEAKRVLDELGSEHGQLIAIQPSNPFNNDSEGTFYDPKEMLIPSIEEE